ncbi:hypothetical protein ONA91_35795, partial [Micromonospora sp. DR5-3]|uniref:hypothetical protein n=1 Tax=unclassified Micromonospora TaxID=2617518 RepID=UPI001CA37A99
MTRFAQWLARHSITALRISLEPVIAGFWALSGTSPAEALVMQATETLAFGAVSGTTAVVITAVLETATLPAPAGICPLLWG